MILRAAAASGESLTAGISSPFNVSIGSPTKLGLTFQPANSTASGAIKGPPTVAVQDSAGNTITTSTAAITIAIGTNPGGGTLTGTAVKNASNGIAAFADLHINQAANGYTLTATSPSLTSATTSAFNITAAGSVAGTITKSVGGGAINGALVEALQSGVVKGTGSSNFAGSYTITGLVPGTYDIRGTAGGFTPQTQAGVTINSGATATANFSLAVTTPTAGIVYIYDELQRLKSVIDPVGEAASYAYDAVGNLLTITRNNASQTSVIDFNPNSGPVGSAVTIYGTGYSATPSQNTVTFNGVAATVLSSTLTQIATTIPVGAISGPIAITSPAGSATSATSFVVSAVPSIASFSPDIGVAGTSVTISGANFSSTPANNLVQFNRFVTAAVGSSTPTSIQTTVPIGAQSGPLSVSTANGAADSVQDFFVIPSPYTSSNVDYKTRITVGGSSLPVSISTANKIGLILFDGVSGQRISFGMTNSNFTCAVYSIYLPNGSQLVSSPNVCTPDFDLDDVLLPTSGTYTFIVAPGPGYIGNVTLTASLDLVGSIIPDGPAVTANITRPGQLQRFRFTGFAGQRVSLGISNVSLSSGCANVRILDTSSAVVGASGAGNCGPGFIDTITMLPGLYTVLVNPSLAGTGTVTLTLYDVAANPTGTISINGPEVTSTMPDPGQDASLTFSGTTGQRINLTVTSSTINGYVYLYKPDGSQWTNTTSGVGSTIDATLPVDGTSIPYTIRINPVDSSIGSMTLALSEEVNAGPIAIDGASVNLITTRAGQRVYTSFTGTTGRRLNIGLNSSTTNGYLQLYDPLGTFVTNTTSGPGDTIDTKLSQDGTYTILLDPVGVGLANSTVSVSEEINGGALTMNGPALPISITRVGQRGYVTFSGNSGQVVSVHFTSNSLGTVSAYLLRPNGVEITHAFTGATNFDISTVTLPDNGTYEVLIDPAVGTSTGGINISVTNP